MEIGRLCVKTAGRDAGQVCVIVDEIDKTYVMIDGNTRRKKCNIAHLHPLGQKLDLKKGASHTDVVNAFKKNDIQLMEKKPIKEGYQKQHSPKKLEKAKKIAEKLTKRAEKKPKKTKEEKKAPVKKKTVKKKTTKAKTKK